MTNADKIRQMSDEQLSGFLWIWKINSVTTFLTQGGMNSMDAKDMRKWVGESTDTFVCTETFVGDDYIFDQDFNVKTDRKTENSSEKPNNCEYAENPSGDVWEWRGDAWYCISGDESQTEDTCEGCIHDNDDDLIICLSCVLGTDKKERSSDAE